jgi:hypothetical protein
MCRDSQRVRSIGAPFQNICDFAREQPQKGKTLGNEILSERQIFR